MSKTNTPFFSLESRGTVGGVLTTQRREKATLVRTKPIPAYRRTLPQQYQRWLYEDYAYLWTQQTAATKREYAAAGVRHHLTGFQYWLKYHLTYLPDIAGWWKLDEKVGALARDSSRNANHGVIIGASPITGIVDGAFLFDGLNDLVNCGNPAAINNLTTFTYRLWVRPRTNFNEYCFAKRHFRHIRLFTTGAIWVYIWYTGVNSYSKSNETLTLDQWARLAITYDEDGDRKGHIFIGGVEVTYASQPASTGTLVDDSAQPLTLGSFSPTEIWLPGDIDDVIINTRVLDDTEILRDSERRYPA